MYLFVDTETGGLAPDIYSLLQVGIVLTDDAFKTIDYAEYSIAHDTYTVTADALKINKINLFDLITKGKTLQEVDDAISISLVNVLAAIRIEEKTPIYLAGWNVGFDAEFLKKNLLKTMSLVHYRRLDIQSVFRFMYPNKSARLSEAAKILDVEADPALLHTALGDAVLTLEVAKKLRSIIK